MNEPRKLLNAEQAALVAELATTYNIEPADILFYGEDKKPFLMYEANSVLCKNLANLIQIGVEPINGSFADSVTVKCTITQNNGQKWSHFGVANLSEKSDGKEISQQQAIRLASSRALRNVLLSAGIDLMQLHYQTKGEVLDFKTQSVFQKLNGEAHALGKQVFLINGADKTAWYFQLRNRYGVNHSNDLTEFQMSDWVSFLKTLVPVQRLAA